MLWIITRGCRAPTKPEWWEKQNTDPKAQKNALGFYYNVAVKNVDFWSSLEVGLPTMVRNMVSGIWICGYLDIWISGYLDIWISGFWQNNGLMHPLSGLLCGVALPGLFFFQRKTGPWCFCNLKPCFLHSTKTIFNGTRLDRRGLKNQCERFQYGTKSMDRKSRNES